MEAAGGVVEDRKKMRREQYDAPLSLVTQHGICVAHCLKLVLCRGILVDVWMELLAELNDLAE